MIIFRVDSSIQIGSGHLMRCLTLADDLKFKNEILFISRCLEGDLNNIVSKEFNLSVLQSQDTNDILSGYEKWLTVKQEKDAEQTIEIIKYYESIDLLIVDSYAIDVKWEKMIRPYVKKLMVIDDLANRKHDCDILLDQNFYCNFEDRYKGLVGEYCNLFLGPKYALLRDEFYKEKGKKIQKNSEIKNIFIFFGGSDLTNDTMKALKALLLLERVDLRVNIVVGTSNIYKEEIEKFCEIYEWINYYCQVSNIAELMNQADLSIGAGGTATWERAFLGLPAIVISVAENQRQLSIDADKIGIIKYLGPSECVSVSDIVSEISYFVSNKAEYNKFKNKIIEFTEKWNKINYAKLLLEG